MQKITAPSKMGRKHNSNLITTGSRHIFTNFLGGSKPPPYHVVVCFVSLATAFGCLSLTMQLLLFRKNHARLACSVVNALTTARCRYQLLRFAGRGKPCSYGMIYNLVRAKHQLLFTFLCPIGLMSREQCVGRTKKQD